jgi:transposase
LNAWFGVALWLISGAWGMALSVDLRERVLAAHERREGSQRVLAERFGVAVGTVNGWLRQARAGRRAPLQRGGGRTALGGAGPEDLTAMVAERPDATLAEYAEMLARRVGRRFSPAVLCRALRRAGLRRKKKPCTRASRSGPMSLPHGQAGGRRSWSRSIPTGSSSSMRAASIRA